MSVTVPCYRCFWKQSVGQFEVRVCLHLGSPISSTPWLLPRSRYIGTHSQYDLRLSVKLLPFIGGLTLFAGAYDCVKAHIRFAYWYGLAPKVLWDGELRTAAACCEWSSWRQSTVKISFSCYTSTSKSLERCLRSQDQGGDAPSSDGHQPAARGTTEILRAWRYP